MSKRDEIFEAFKTKSCVKQEVHSRTQNTFLKIKQILRKISSEYQEFLRGVDNRVLMSYREEGDYGTVLGFGGDLLVFQMHSNVFSFAASNPIHKHSYIANNPTRVFCGIINVYNFLADSFKYNRENDLGFLVSRIFVNMESHIFVEGKSELGYRFTDFSTQTDTIELLTEIIESSIQYALDFDLYTPDFNKSQLVTVAQMKQLSKDQKVSTAKRLGFRMHQSNGMEG